MTDVEDTAVIKRFTDMVEEAVRLGIYVHSHHQRPLTQALHELVRNLGVSLTVIEHSFDELMTSRFGMFGDGQTYQQYLGSIEPTGDPFYRVTALDIAKRIVRETIV